MRKISLILFLVLILVVPGAVAQTNPEQMPYEVILDFTHTASEESTIYVPLTDLGGMYKISGSSSTGTNLLVRSATQAHASAGWGCGSGFVNVGNGPAYIAANPVEGDAFTYACITFDIISLPPPPPYSWIVKVEKVYSDDDNPFLFAAGNQLANAKHKMELQLSAGSSISAQIEWKYPNHAGNSTPPLSAIPEHASINTAPPAWFGLCVRYRLKNTNNNWSACNSTTPVPSTGIYTIDIGWGSTSGSRGTGLVQLSISGSGGAVNCTKIYSKRSNYSPASNPALLAEDIPYEMIFLEGNYTGGTGYLYDFEGDLLNATRVSIREGADGPITRKSLPATVTIPAPYFYLGDRGAGVLFYNSTSDPIFPAPFVLELCAEELAPIPTPSPTPPTTCLELSGDYTKSPVSLEISGIYENWIVTVTAATFPVYYDLDGLTYDEGQFFRVRAGGGKLTSNSTFSVYLCTSVQPSPTPTPVLCSYLTSEFINGLHRILNSKLVFFTGYYAQVSYASSTVELYGAGTTRVMITSGGAHLVYADSYAYSTQQFQLAFCGSRADPIPTATGTITPTPTGSVTVTVTVTETPTATPTGTVTGTAVPTPTRGYPDGIPTPTWCPPWLMTPSPVGIHGVVPDFAIPWPQQGGGVTSTIEITFTMHITPVLTAQALLLTPIAQAEQMSSAFSPESASEFSQAATGYMSPALSWLSILNPTNAAWSAVGGPLWALSPVLLPLLPILMISMLLAVANIVMFIFNWLLKLFDVIVKLIELIPGE